MTYKTWSCPSNTHSTYHSIASRSASNVRAETWSGQPSNPDHSATPAAWVTYPCISIYIYNYIYYVCMYIYIIQYMTTGIVSSLQYPISIVFDIYIILIYSHHFNMPMSEPTLLQMTAESTLGLRQLKNQDQKRQAKRWPWISKRRSAPKPESGLQIIQYSIVYMILWYLFNICIYIYIYIYVYIYIY